MSSAIMSSAIIARALIVRAIIVRVLIVRTMKGKMIAKVIAETIAGGIVPKASSNIPNSVQK